MAWTVVADRARTQAAAAGTAAYRHALAVGFDCAFLVGARIAVLILLIAIVTIRIRRADLGGG